MRFYIEPAIKPTKKPRKKRVAKVDALEGTSNALGFPLKQAKRVSPADTSLPACPPVSDGDIQTLARETQTGTPAIIPEPETYYWGMRYGQLEIILTDRVAAYCYLHGMESITKTENIELLSKIEKIKV
jgi:hypothetical protein